MKAKLQVTLALTALVMAIGLAGCGDKEYEAAPVNESTDKCEVCNMMVGDDGFATQLITEEGKVYKFDDLGCMNEWKQKNGTDNIAIEFVRDYNTREWVKLDHAFFAYDPAFQSPMAYGLVSFKDQPTAQAYIDEQGKGQLLSAADLSAHKWERNMSGGHMQMDGHHENAHKESNAHGKQS